MFHRVELQGVEPFPNASRLKVYVALHDEAKGEAAEVLRQTRKQVGRLRAELAAALNRKRVPELVIDLALPLS